MQTCWLPQLTINESYLTFRQRMEYSFMLMAPRSRTLTGAKESPTIITAKEKTVWKPIFKKRGNGMTKNVSVFAPSSARNLPEIYGIGGGSWWGTTKNMKKNTGPQCVNGICRESADGSFNDVSFMDQGIRDCEDKMVRKAWQFLCMALKDLKRDNEREPNIWKMSINQFLCVNINVHMQTI